MQEGSPIDVYERPENPFVADFIGSINFFSTDILPKANLTTDKGLVTTLEENKTNLKACRPENIEIVEHKSLNSFNAQIHDIEFHGYGYRLQLDISHAEEQMVNGEYISFDISTDEFERIHPKVGDVISIRFKKGKLYYFNKETA